MIGKGRILLEGRSPHAHEQEALTFIREVLPNTDPYHLWELVELVDPGTGRLLEIDALILGYRALYLVEIKSGPGTYEGDTVDWYRSVPGEPTRPMDPPLRATNYKAKVLKSLLQRRMGGAPCPWVQPLVFLSHQEARLKLRNFGDQCVVLRGGLLKAVQHHDFPGVGEMSRPPRPVDRRATKALVEAFESIGIRPSRRETMVGNWKLGEVLEDGPGYQDRLAVHVDNEAFKRRARAYLVPDQTSVERRQQLRRAASREAQLLEDVKGHPNILRISDYVSDGPLGPTVLFDHFDGVPLDAFLRRHPTLSFQDRIALIEQVALALTHCHDKEVIHGGLSPSAVLVRAREEGPPECRLYNFQLGMSAEVSHTLHWSALADAPWAAYQAPELRADPTKREPAGDLFSLGALAYFVLTGKAPAEGALEADARLTREGHFDPTAVDDGIPPNTAEVIRNATSFHLIQRPETPAEFIEYLHLDDAPAGAPTAAEELNPLEAKREDVLGEDFIVAGVLGQGASSRVLQVDRVSDGRSYALKIALTEEDDGRLLEEAAILQELRSARIVPLVDRPVLGGRQCLLLGLAGSETLARHLKREGIVSLDYAARYGEDLLFALEELEDHAILHRDIKPANVGVGTATKTKHHLTLFDFSLGLDLKRPDGARHGRSQIAVGTSVYRDPFLRQRGGWDFAADRFSAAVTLYEMLTGTRPGWEPEGAAGLDPDARLVLAAERFDASVRDRLTEFFTRALAAADRHESAVAMRQAWNQCFAAPVAAAVPLPRPPAESQDAADPPAGAPAAARAAEAEVPEPLGEASLAALTPETPIASLPLSSRAINALDRAGLLTLGDLAQLPDNRLSAVRGAGRLVAKEILELRNRWRAVVQATDAAHVEPFYPTYRGDDASLAGPGLTLDGTWARALCDAGLRTLAVVAEAPRAQVERVAAHSGDPTKLLAQLRGLLDARQKQAREQEHPSTLEAWLDALLPPKKKASAHLAALFGLSGPCTGRVDVSVAEAAEALGMTRANLYLALQRAKEHWRAQAAWAELSRAAHAVVDRAGGVLSVTRAALGLLERIPSAELSAIQDDPAARELALERAKVRAAALLRVVGLLEREEEAGLRWERLPSGQPWLLAFEGALEVVTSLGAIADELAARDVLAASGEVVRVLRPRVKDTPLQALTDERLTELAAEASRTAARSSRLELYPRGLAPERAIILSTTALTGPLSPEEVERRVLARYPAAAPLPRGPALEELLRPLGLLWSAVTGQFARPEERSTTLSTSHTLLRPRTAPTDPRRHDPAAVERGKFEDDVRVAIERGRFRVLGVRADGAVAAAQLLTKAFGLRLVDLDRELLATMDDLIQEIGVDPVLVTRTDRAGSAGDDWGELRMLMERVAERVAERLLPAREPLLLIHPGLIARFQLVDFARRLVETNRAVDAAAVFLLVPGHDTAGVPRINGTFVLPEVGPSDALAIPPGWLRPSSRAA